MGPGWLENRTNPIRVGWVGSRFFYHGLGMSQKIPNPNFLGCVWILSISYPIQIRRYIYIILIIYIYKLWRPRPGAQCRWRFEVASSLLFPLLLLLILLLLLSSSLFPMTKRETKRERERERDREKDRESVREAAEEEDATAPLPLGEEEEILSRPRWRWSRIVARRLSLAACRSSLVAVVDTSERYTSRNFLLKFLDEC